MTKSKTKNWTVNSKPNAVSIPVATVSVPTNKQIRQAKKLARIDRQRTRTNARVQDRPGLKVLGQLTGLLNGAGGFVKDAAKLMLYSSKHPNFRVDNAGPAGMRLSTTEWIADVSTTAAVGAGEILVDVPISPINFGQRTADMSAQFVHYTMTALASYKPSISVANANANGDLLMFFIPDADTNIPPPTVATVEEMYSSFSSAQVKVTDQGFLGLLPDQSRDYFVSPGSIFDDSQRLYIAGRLIVMAASPLASNTSYGKIVIQPVITLRGMTTGYVQNDLAPNATGGTAHIWQDNGPGMTASLPFGTDPPFVHSTTSLPVTFVVANGRLYLNAISDYVITWNIQGTVLATNQYASNFELVAIEPASAGTANIINATNTVSMGTLFMTTTRTLQDGLGPWIAVNLASATTVTKIYLYVSRGEGNDAPLVTRKRRWRTDLIRESSKAKRNLSFYQQYNSMMNPTKLIRTELKLTPPPSTPIERLDALEKEFTDLTSDLESHGNLVNTKAQGQDSKYKRLLTLLSNANISGPDANRAPPAA